ncbi:restriction endonuclease subunit S [Halopseudomonas sp.]|uniref:restriction endonuclease subunit S n=1 Tax=Halopseudomonas sp. TaxID=2901191 RepID=UPI003001A6F3
MTTILPEGGGNGFPLKFQGEVTGTYPFFKVSDMNNEGNETRMFVANNYISDITRKTLGATIFAENSIVFAKVGAAIFLERKRILAQPSCLDNNMTAFELDDKKADYRYVHHRLIHTRLSDLVSTTALPSLSGNVLSQIKFPLPMLEEQRAIASALSDVDVLLTEIDRLIAKKRDIQQATMQQLLTGQRRLPGFSDKWEMKRLGDVASLNRFNIIPFATPDKTFVHFSLPAFDEGKRPVREPGAAIGSNKFSVPANAILVSKLNPRIPRVWLPQDIPTNAVASTEFLVLTPRDGVTREFLYVVCKSSSFCAQMELAATGTTGSHQRISPGSALGLSVNVPSEKSEQSAIATILFDMDTEIASLESRLEKTRQLKQGMMQELLTGRVRLV